MFTFSARLQHVGLHELLGENIFQNGMSKILGSDGEPRMMRGPVKKYLDCVWQMHRRVVANALGVSVDHDDWLKHCTGC